MKYTVNIWGYGCEVTIGSCDKELMEELLEEGDLNDKVFDLSIPYHEVDDQLHCWGATLDESTIVITDENGVEVFNTDTGLGIDDDLEYYQFQWKEIDTQKNLLMTISHEKGSFFDAEFECEQFDPSKLKVIIQEEIGIDQYWLGDIIYGVSYDGEELDNFGGDTSGKAFDAVINFDKGTLREMKLDDIL